MSVCVQTGRVSRPLTAMTFGTGVLPWGRQPGRTRPPSAERQHGALVHRWFGYLHISAARRRRLAFRAENSVIHRDVRFRRCPLRRTEALGPELLRASRVVNETLSR